MSKTAVAVTQQRSQKKKSSENKFKLGMLLPLLTVFIVTVGFPLGYAFYLSLTNRKLTRPGAEEFQGVDNYIGAFENTGFWSALWVTFSFVFFAVLFELVIGLTIALALQRQKWVRNITRSLLLAPMFITPIAVGLTFRFLLNDQLGAIPEILSWFGISYDFFGPGNALFTIAMIDVWQWTPFMVLLLLAGLESIPKSPIEAAKVDGGGAWYIFRRIKLPLLAPVLIVAVLLRSLDALKVFEYVYATTRGGPGVETQTLQYFIYQEGIQFFRLGPASAMAFLVLAIVLSVIIVIFRRLEKEKA